MSRDNIQMGLVPIVGQRMAVKDFVITLRIECYCGLEGEPPMQLLFAGAVGAGAQCARCQDVHVLKGFKFLPEFNAIAWDIQTVRRPQTPARPEGDSKH